MFRLVVPAYIHTLFEVAAFIVGFRYYLFLRKKSGDAIPEVNRIWIIVGAAAGALIGSRLVGALEDPSWLHHISFARVFTAFNNKTIVGGLFGGILGVESIKKIISEKQRSGDLFVFPILLALFIGRIGCFLTALSDHTAGGPTSLPWGIDYGDGIYRQPLPLYEMIFLGITFFVLWKIKNKKILAEGALFKIMMLTYFLYRFVNEFSKADYIYFWNLTAIQIVCCIGILYYANVFLKPKHLLKSHA
jgi:phosphatidylglycerol:prolipoprotein diacylglycerol transferase